MKKIILAIAFCSLSAISCSAQHIIPLEDTYTYIGSEGGLLGDRDYVYVKDVNNLRDKFVGTWKGLYDLKSYEVVITPRTTDDGELKEDELLLRYKITDINGVVENTLNLPDDSPFVLKNGYMNESQGYVFSYIGRDVACGQNGWVFTQVYGDNKEKLQFFLSVEGENYPECTTGAAVQILPTESMELIKQ
ncbi:MAG: hypothetical protein CL868_11895 [Cytophagaceae bacterium]|nr:hypothetical protein [Cytophagaceae bacterium]|tara:strand:- start:1384 stop:1956 length:573 start_codon:yes stop_codon:yes gene_type:complete